ncbi:MAG: cytochrome c [Rhodobacterales bacterium]|nr:cytochrome c [Rhodobacterales bacterium]
MRVFSGLLVAILVSGLAACVEAPQSAGRALFEKQCAVCHGAKGRGDGPYAGQLQFPPADLAVLAANNGGVFPAGDVMAKIYGYPGVSYNMPMPDFGPVLDGPKVMWVDPDGTRIATPKALVDLADYVESLQT